tara:strand:- start:1144 stop:1839 length:696 start_codon:yes stop_codon:yes gene_type:complete
MNKTVFFKDLGLIDYKECWDYQEGIFLKTLKVKSLNRKKNSNIPTKNFMIFCEHPHVYTIGKNGNKTNLLINNGLLKSKGVDFYETNRGGDITYHGPGQLVAYPIFDLDNFFSDIHKYLRLLEEVVILTLKDYGIKGERSKGETGVWLDVGSKNARKICAFGVKSSRWVTMHGLALNINTDLSFFNYIVPCGISDKGVTSINKEINNSVCMNELKNKLKSHFRSVFDINFI